MLLDPVASGSILDKPRDGTGDILQTTSTTRVRQIGDEEYRAIAEFDLSGLSAPVNLAVLDLQLYDRMQGEPTRTFDLIGYAANGQAELADFAAPGTVLHTVTFWGEQAGGLYQLDVTDEVNALLAGGTTHFGLRADAVNDVVDGGLDAPRLSINGLPPLAGRRDWETIPNVIRADGVDSFRVEVNLYGEVRSVVIPYAPYVVGEGPAPYLLRDDGTGGDQVAGDFIYTSEQFRYNTDPAFALPYDFFRGNPDSPQGIATTFVGPVVITELDGSETGFLNLPGIGFLDPSILDVAMQRLSPEVVISDHVVNVQTQAMATQRSMRGPEIVLDQVTGPIYQQLPDVFDFLMFFSTNKVEHEPFRSTNNFNAGLHVPVRTDYTGNSRGLFDRSADFGSAGQLQALNLLDAFERGIWDANAVHELVHQWSAFLEDNVGITDYPHYLHNSSVGSIVGGLEWLDNGDGSFTINFDRGRNRASEASPLDLYFMGLIEPDDVPPIQVLDMTVSPPKSPSNPVVLADEILRTVTVDDIIARYGPRLPGPAAAQRDFRIGFVAESHNRPLTPTEMTFYEILAANFAKPIPEEEPPPLLYQGWAPMTKFFGHGTTWETILPGRQYTNQPPVIADAVFEISETAAGGSAVGIVPASDSDAGQTLRYLITGGNEDEAFTIDPDTGLVRVSAGANLLSNAQYTLRVRVMDDGVPNLWDAATVLIRVTDDNQPPVITGQTWTIVENSLAGTVVGTAEASDPDQGQTVLFRFVSGNDDNAFAIDPATGVVTVNNPAALDYETRQSLTLSIEAADNGDPSQAATAGFTIRVADANESPAMVGQALTIAENSPAESVVGTASASDPDQAQTLTYRIIAGNDDDAFAIHPATGVLTVDNAAVLDYETGQPYVLTVEAADDGNPSLAATATFTVSILDINEPPVIAAQTWTVVENSPAGTVVGTAQASDPDEGQSLAYRIVAGNDGGAFAIDSSTGVVTVSNAAAVDYEIRQSFLLTIEAADNGDPSLATTATFTINVTDLADILIDVKPGDSTNTINLKFDNKLAVAILSTPSFNATTQVDMNSLTFGKTGTENSLIRHRKTGQPQVEFRDVNSDGFLDLVAYFDMSKTGLLVGDTVAILGGRLTSGASFLISSPVRVVSSKR